MFNIVSFRFLGKHKWCTATVTLREGTGKVTIKSPFVQTSVNDILYFTRIIHRFVCRTNFDESIGFLLVINCCIHLKSQIESICSMSMLFMMELDLQHKLLPHVQQYRKHFVRLFHRKKLNIFDQVCVNLHVCLVQLFFLLLFCLNSAGLLTDDGRRKERKQPGKRNARRKYKL